MLAQIASMLAQIASIIAKGIHGRAPRPAGVFPLRLGWKAISVAAGNCDLGAVDPVVRNPLLSLAQLIAKLDGVEPAHILHREIVRSLEIARGLLHHRLV